jgi:hypothetical protein
MGTITQADMIWNRACGENPIRSLPGDRALTDLLRAHGLAMNGGVLHAVELLSASELCNAESGYRLYGLDSAASLLSRARAILDANDNLDLHERELDHQYLDMIPDDSMLVARFQKHLELFPSDYASLRAKDMIS